MALTRRWGWGRAVLSGLRARPATQRTLLPGLLLINGVVLGLAVALLVNDWQAEIRDAEVDTLNMARLLARDVDATLDRADIALSSAVRALQRPLADGTLDLKALPATLAEAAALVPEVRRIVIFDAAGRPICGAPPAPCPSVDLAGRRLLEQLRAQPDAPASLHGPWVGAKSHQRWLVLVRGLRGPDGALVGVAAATLTEATLRNVLLGIDLGPQGAVSLLNSRLRLLVRAPELTAAAEPPAGSTVSPTLQAAIAAQPAEGTSRARSGIDGVERVAAYRHLSRHGAYVVVGLARQDLLASWWRLAAGTLALVLLVAVGSWALLRADTRAEARAAKLRRLYDEAPCGYHTLDAQGRYLAINATELSWLGCRRDEVVGRLTLADFLDAAGRSAFAQRFPGLQRDGVIKDLELGLVGRDGTQRQVLINARALYDGAGRYVGANSVMHDITALRLAEQQRLQLVQLQAQNQQLQEASAERDEFVANLAHELRTPLNAVLGFTQILQSGRVAPDSERFARNLAQIGASGRHLLQLIDTMLGHAKAASDRLPLQQEPVRVQTVMAEAVTLMQDRCAARGVTIHSQVDDSLHTVDADPLRLRQVLQGLLDNAVKFSPPGARVELRAMAVNGDTWALDVEDRGIGIAEADLPLLFTPYHQLSSGSTKSHAGLGLGLALVQRLVRAHGGHVTVTSRPGQGTLFRVLLPRRAH